KESKLSTKDPVYAQMFSDHIQLVTWDREKDEVVNFMNGERIHGRVSSLYDPMVLIHAYLKKNGGEFGLTSPFTDQELKRAGPSEFLMDRLDLSGKGANGASTNTNLGLPVEKVRSGQGPQ